MRQRSQKWSAILSRFHQHRMLVGQVAGQLVIVAHEFAAGAVEGLQPLRDAAGANPVHDAHGFDSAVAQMKKGAVVIARRQRLVHFLQPLARIIGAARTLRQCRQQSTDHGARNQPIGPTRQRFGHGAVRASGA